MKNKTESLYLKENLKYRNCQHESPLKLQLLLWNLNFLNSTIQTWAPLDILHVLIKSGRKKAIFCNLYRPQKSKYEVILFWEDKYSWFHNKANGKLTPRDSCWHFEPTGIVIVEYLHGKSTKWFDWYNFNQAKLKQFYPIAIALLYGTSIILMIKSKL
jgi:hypothetical protein